MAKNRGDVDLESFMDLKREVESFRDKYRTLEGMFQQAMLELTKKHGCKDLREAEKKLSDLKKKAAKMREETKTKIADFLSKYPIRE